MRRGGALSGGVTTTAGDTGASAAALGKEEDEDDIHHGSDLEADVQKLTDQYIAKIDAHLQHKEKEIMTV